MASLKAPLHFQGIHVGFWTVMGRRDLVPKGQAGPAGKTLCEGQAGAKGQVA